MITVWAAARLEAVTNERISVVLPRSAAFWLMGGILALLMIASSAPSPLYDVYQQAWHFPATTLTAVFAVYAVALLSALLVTGRLSDHVGRRPVIIAALVAEGAGMGCFVAAHSVPLLYLARVLQGLATGAATGAISASLIELQPRDRPQLGSLVNSSAPTIGLAVGAAGASILVQYAPAPLRLVYWLLLAASVLGIIGTALAGEPGKRRPGALASLRPDVGVPRAARRAFCAALPCLIATWALGGLYLSLGPSIASAILRTGNHVASGLIIVVLSGVSAVAAIAFRGSRPRQAMCVGCLLLAAGVAGTVVSIAASSGTGFFLATAVAGFGFGLAFLGVFRTLSALAPAHARAGLIATIYVVSYLAFGLPVIAAGIAVTHIGLRDTAIGYGIVVAVLAAAAGLATAFMTGRGADPAGHAELPPPGPCSVPMCLSAPQPAPAPAAAAAPAGR
ncbi:MAG: MFS transporter [Trebonia sp.]